MMPLYSHSVVLHLKIIENKQKKKKIEIESIKRKC